MKKLVTIIITVIMLLTVPGCRAKQHNTNSDYTASQEITVNLPVDGTVNGYKTRSGTNSSEMPDTLSENEVEAGTYSVSENISSANNKSSGTYCANTKTRVFHKSTCSSVKTMKEENKLNSTNRDMLISQGYSPCKRCKP